MVMELDEQPLRVILSDTGRYSPRARVARRMFTGYASPKCVPPSFFLLGNAPLKPVNDDSERREDDQGKVRLHLTLGNNQNDALP